MDAYPKPYVDHNLPLVCISGIGTAPAEKEGSSLTSSSSSYPQLHDHGLTIQSDFPLLTTATAHKVLNSICRQDDSRRPWNSLFEQLSDDVLRLKIKQTGRVGQRLPMHRTFDFSRKCGHALWSLFLHIGVLHLAALVGKREKKQKKKEGRA